MANIGFIGLGNMGAPMAEHLVSDGHNVVVYDIDAGACEQLAEAGATIGDDPAAVAASSEVVFLSLPGPDAVRAVVEGADGIMAGANEGLTIVDTTTSTPSTSNEIAERSASVGITFLGSPVSGGVSGAKAGTLTAMVGGDEATFEAAKPLFSSFATNRYHVGDAPGDGNAVKLLNNYLSFLGMLGASEAVALGECLGLDPTTMVDIFNRSSGRNAATEEKFPEQIIPGHYDIGMSLELMYKDIRLFGRLADENGAPVVLGDTVRNLIGYAKQDFGGDADMSRLYDYVAAHMDPSEGS